MDAVLEYEGLAVAVSDGELVDVAVSEDVTDGVRELDRVALRDAVDVLLGVSLIVKDKERVPVRVDVRVRVADNVPSVRLGDSVDVKDGDEVGDTVFVLVGDTVDDNDADDVTVSDKLLLSDSDGVDVDVDDHDRDGVRVAVRVMEIVGDTVGVSDGVGVTENTSAGYTEADTTCAITSTRMTY